MSNRFSRAWEWAQQVEDHLALFAGKNTSWTETKDQSFTSEHNAWIVDLLVLFIQRTLLREAPTFEPQTFIYLRNVGFSPKTQRVLQLPRQPPYSNPNTFGAQVYLLTFLHSGNRAHNGVLWLTDTHAELFLPWADDEEEGINLGWFLKKKQEVYTYQLSENWRSSNIWIPYFLLLRSLSSRENTQALLGTAQLQLDLQKHAESAWRSLTHNISICVEDQKDNLLKAKSIAELIGLEATKSFRLNNQIIDNAGATFLQCHVSDWSWLLRLVPDWDESIPNQEPDQAALGNQNFVGGDPDKLIFNFSADLPEGKRARATKEYKESSCVLYLRGQKAKAKGNAKSKAKPKAKPKVKAKSKSSLKQNKK